MIDKIIQLGKENLKEMDVGHSYTSANKLSGDDIAVLPQPCLSA